jgi:flavin-dependent dehydrogenase
MVSGRSLGGSSPDVVVVGGGPAGLAAAIVAALRGVAVLVLEQRAFPPDKACGEGLLPPAVCALERLGVLTEIPHADRRPFAGIRFIQEDGVGAALPLPGGGLGVRRTVLVEAMARRATRLGVVIADRTPVRAVERGGSGALVRTAHGDVRTRLVVAADGLHSPLRREARLTLRPGRRRRFALRQHFALRPWSDDVEVYVDALGEAVVTPVSDHTVNVNFVWEQDLVEHPTLATLCARFPTLEARLAGAPPASTIRGAGPMARYASRRTCHRLALIGDAGGFVDSIAADGLSMAFNSALALGETLPGILARDATVASLAPYERAARRLFRNYQLVTNGLLWIARHPTLRRRLVRYLSQHQAVGDAMMSGAMRLMLASAPV